MTASSELFVPLECRPHDRASFGGLLQAGIVGPLALSRLEVSPHTIRRTAALAADTDGDRYKLSLLLGGQALVVQDGREAVLRPGDFALYDCSRPYTIEGAGDFRMLVCMLPRTVLGLEPERVARMTATRIRGDDGIAWAVAPFLERLADLAIRGEVPEGARPRRRERRRARRVALRECYRERRRSSLLLAGRAPPPCACVCAVAPRRPVARARRDRGRSARLEAVPPPALRGRRLDGLGLDPAAAARGMPSRSRGSVTARRDGDEYRRALGPDEPRPPEPALPRRVRRLAHRVPRGAPARRDGG